MRLTSIAPQFLVSDLEAAIAYYQDALGFRVDFIYESFYAAVSRDRATIHLKHGDPQSAERERRKAEEHLDAYITVEDITSLLDDVQARGAQVIKPLEQRAWGNVDFYVEDLDGYVICFSD